MPITINSPSVLLAGIRGTCQNYEQALKNCGFRVLYPPAGLNETPYLLSDLSAMEFDLLLLPGGGDISPLLYMSGNSAHSLSDDTPASICNPPDYVSDLLQFLLLQTALLQKKPILGICKGMQLLNVWFGGSLYPHLPTADFHAYDSGDRMHSVFFTPLFPERTRIFGCSQETADRLYTLLDSFPIVNSAHHQGIRHLGKHMITLAHSEDYLPETIAHRHLPILGLQWHPERLPGFSENNFGNLIHLLLQSARL